MNCPICNKPAWLCDAPQRVIIKGRVYFYHECCLKTGKPCASVELWSDCCKLDGTANEEGT